MTNFSYETEERKYVEARNKKQQELLGRLCFQASSMDKNEFFYYLSMIKLEKNAWNEESHKYYNFSNELYREIISFNLQYYLATFLCNNVDKNSFNFTRSDICHTTRIDANRGKKGVIVNKPFCDDDNGLCLSWVLEFNMPRIVDEKFNVHRLKFLKELRDELKSRDAGTYWISRRIKDIESQEVCTQYYNNVTDSYSKEMSILKPVFKDYGIKVPRKQDYSQFEYNLSELDLEELKDLAEINQEYEAIKTISQGTDTRKVLIKKTYLCSYSNK